MPTLQQATKQPANLSDFSLVTQPPAAARPMPTPDPNSMPNYEALSLAPAPAVMSTDIDRQRQFYRHGVSQYRISPLPSKANPQINASARSVVTQVLASTPPASGGITSVGFTAPKEAVITGSPIGVPGGTIIWTWASEMQNTVFAAAGGTALDQVDVISTGFGGSPASLSATPSHSGDLALVMTAQDVNTGTAFNPGAPWSFVIGSGTNINIYNQVISGTTSVTASGPTGSAPAWDGVLMLLGAKLGFTPTVVHSSTVISGAFGTQTNLALGFTPTAGNTLLFIFSTGFANFSNPSPILSFFSDSNGDVFTILAQASNSSASGTKTVVVGAKSIAGGATTVSFVLNPSAVNGSLIALEISNLSSISTVPGFRFLVPADLPPINLSSNNANGGVTGILGRGNLPAQVAYTDAANIFVTTQRLSTTSGPNLVVDGFGSGAHSQFDINANVEIRYDLSPFGAAGLGVLAIGGTQTFPILVLAPQAATTGDAIQLYAPGSTTAKNFVLAITGKIANYNGVATVSGGIPAEYAVSDLTAQSAAITPTTIYAVPAGGQGMYRISWSADITTVDAVSSTLGGAGGFQAIYTSPTDSVVKTTVSQSDWTSTANTTGTAVGGTAIVYAKASTNIQFSFGYISNTPGQMIYELHIKVEAL